MGSQIKTFLGTLNNVFLEKIGFEVEKLGKISLKKFYFGKNPQLITVKDFDFWLFMTPRPSTFKI